MTKSKISPQEAFDRLNAIYDIEYVDGPQECGYHVGVKLKSGPYRAILPSPVWEIDWPLAVRQWPLEKVYTREATESDVGKFVEVYCGEKLKLLAVLPEQYESRYICEDRDDPNDWDSYEQCWIEEKVTKSQGLPISTASKEDGKEIRLLMGGEWLIGYWDKNNQLWFSTGNNRTWVWDEANQPTEWRSL
jgi:hypothetical protein